MEVIRTDPVAESLMIHRLAVACCWGGQISMSSARRLICSGCIAVFNVYAAETATNFAHETIAASDLMSSASTKIKLISCAHARLSNATITPEPPQMMENFRDPSPTMASIAGMISPEIGPASNTKEISLFVKPIVRRWGFFAFVRYRNM